MGDEEDAEEDDGYEAEPLAQDDEARSARSLGESVSMKRALARKRLTLDGAMAVLDFLLEVERRGLRPGPNLRHYMGIFMYHDRSPRTKMTCLIKMRVSQVMA